MNDGVVQHQAGSCCIYSQLYGFVCVCDHIDWMFLKSVPAAMAVAFVSSLILPSKFQVSDPVESRRSLTSALLPAGWGALRLVLPRLHLTRTSRGDLSRQPLPVSIQLIVWAEYVSEKFTCLSVFTCCVWGGTAVSNEVVIFLWLHHLPSDEIELV